MKTKTENYTILTDQVLLNVSAYSALLTLVTLLSDTFLTYSMDL